MAQVVKLKRTAVSGKVPSTSNLELGELAINTYDGRIFFEKDNGTPSIEHVVTTNSATTGSINVFGNVTASYFYGDGSNLTNLPTPEISQVATATASFEDTSSISINHNFNSRNVVVSVYDNSYSQLIPTSVVLTDNDNVDITLSGPHSGFAVVAKGGHIVSGTLVQEVSEVSTVTASFDNQSTITVTHNFESKNIIISVYDLNDSQLIPQSVTLTDLNTATIVLSGNHSGFVVVAKGGHFVTGSAITSYNTLIDIPSGLVSGSSQLTSSFDTRYTLSGSITQTTWDTIENKPLGIISGSSQITSSFDERYTLSGSVQPLPSGLISGSSQLTSSYDSRYVLSGSITQTTWDNIENKPLGIVSGSSQLTGSYDTRYTLSGSVSSTFIRTVETYTATQGQTIFPITASAEVNNVDVYINGFKLLTTDFDVTNSNTITLTTGSTEGEQVEINLYNAFAGTFLTTEDLNGLVSGSSQISYDELSNIPVGVVSGSLQVVGILDSLNSYTSSNDITNTNQDSRLTSLESVTGSFETKGSGIISGSSQIIPLLPTGVVSGSSQVEFNDVNNTPFSQSLTEVTTTKSIVPSTSTLDLGTPSNPFRDLYLSSASLYIDGTQVVSSNADTLTFTTDVGQSIKILETGADDITLQTDTGNIELKGTVEILSGKKITDSAGTKILFGNSLGITGSIDLTGTVDGVDLSQLKTDFDTLEGKTLISSSQQITDGSGIISGSVLRTLDGTGVFSGSSQVTISSTNGFESFSSSIDSSIQIEKGRIDAILISADADKDSFAEIVTLINSVDTTNDNAFASFYTASNDRFDSIESFTSSIDTTIKTKLNTENVISGSSQITLSSTTGYDSVLNQAVLTTSTPTFGGLTLNGSLSGTSGTFSGNVVVGGTTSLATAANRGNLTINGTNTSILSFGTSDTLKSYVYNDGTNMNFNSGNGVFTFEANNVANSLYISGSGVGIGTASPGARFEIKQGASEIPMIIDSSAISNAAYTQYQVGNSAGWEVGMAGSGDSYKYLFSYGDFGTENSKFTLTSAGVASFAGSVNSGGDITSTGGYQGRYSRLYEASAQRGGMYTYNVISGGGTDYSIGLFSEGELFLAPGGSATKKFTMNSSGAATFGSDVTLSSGNILLGSNSNQYIRYRTASAWDYYLKGDSDDFVIYDSQGTEFFRAIYNGGGTGKYAQFLNSLRAHNNSNVTVLGTLTENSSIRYKENVETLTNSLDKVIQLRGVTYTKKDTGITELGLIAEEVNEILPEVVLKNEQGEPDSISYARITALLIESIKELKLEIEELKKNR